MDESLSVISILLFKQNVYELYPNGNKSTRTFRQCSFLTVLVLLHTFCVLGGPIECVSFASRLGANGIVMSGVYKGSIRQAWFVVLT